MAAAPVRLPGVFYLDDPSDGASAHLLKEAGAVLLRADAAARNPAGEAATAAAGLVPAAARNGLTLAPEHSFPTASGYAVGGGGGALLDVRDGADAWVRLVLSPGDVVLLDAGVQRRLPAAGTPAVVMPAWPADADRGSRMSSVTFARPAEELAQWGAVAVLLPPAAAGDAAGTIALRFAPGSAEEAAANVPHFSRPGVPHTRATVVDLCESFYGLGWVTGTGGGVSIRHGGRVFMAPSGVQKERMQPQDMFVLDSAGGELAAPRPLPGKPRLKLSQCAPLFQHAFSLRAAGACIHTHDISAVMCTLQNAREFAVTHQEMIKGLAGHGFLDTAVVPIIENTPHECDLADSLEEAMRRYPRSNAVLVRRHGVYVWGASWEAAKTQAECYHYLFDAAVRMRALGLDPAATPARLTDGIGAHAAYGTELAGTGGKRQRVEAGGAEEAAAARQQQPASSASSCCDGHADPGSSSSSSSSGGGAGFHGAAGVAAAGASAAALLAAHGPAPPSAAPGCLRDIDCVLLDIEGTTSSISFVADMLFPYAASHLRQHLLTHWGDAEAARDVAALAAQSAEDVAAGVPGAAAVAVTPAHAAAFAAAGCTQPAHSAALAAIEANVAWQMAANRKSGCLKQLQGHIWRGGYETGALRGHVFEDTPPALAGWVAAGKRVYIYSSGSREAQRLLFAHSLAGDLRGHLSGYFDTRVGPKLEPGSYSDIVLSLGVDGPARVLFVTDALGEAVAAGAAGLRVAVTERPGNVALPPGHGFAAFDSLGALLAATRG